MFPNIFGRRGVFPPMHPFPGRGQNRFQSSFKCYSGVFLTDRARPNFENGGKILLPESALEHLVEEGGIMLFKLTNMKEKRSTHSGVLEFVQTDSDRCFLPRWMMENLLLKDGDTIQIESVSLETATFARFQPQTKDFLDITNPKAVLEKFLRDFSCLTKDDVLVIPYLNRQYEIRVLELKPRDAVAIIECDMEVDFAPPLGYVEPNYKPTASQNISGTPKTTDPLSMTPGGDPQLSIPSSFKSPSTFLPFHGQGHRLNGKQKGKEQEHQTPSSFVPQARGIPNYDYEYGTLQFIRTPLRSINDEINDDEKGSSSQFQPFSGEGNMLKPTTRPK